MLRGPILAALLAVTLPISAAAQPAPDPHCLSVNPRKLALTPDRVARIRAIVASEPDSRARRAAIERVLSRTQQMIYWSRAGIAAC